MSEPNEHRLPSGVRPSSYRLTIRTPSADERFTGDVSIEATVVEPTSTIVCNTLDLEISDVTLVANGDPVGVSFRVDASTERLILDTQTPLPPGPITLSIRFSGVFNQNLVGMYRSTFEDDGVPTTMTVTQFEAPHARRVFPCWDEPSFKATFEISLECDPGLLAVSNSPEIGRRQLDDGLVRFDFAPTMTMSTYLVAWVIGDLEVSDTVRGGSTDIRLIHRPGQGHLTAFALECASHAVGWFEDYYGIAYPGQKLDLIAVPDFAFGAMENLGCVTFREVLLLIDPERSNRAEQERAATVIEHEIAHMWFGDLVTMTWWDGIWLNEAFATFMEFCCADSFRPSWEIWTSFGLSKSAAFDTDALANTRPIEFEVTTPSQAEGMFDILTYEKGASILRMFEQWAGPAKFRDGVRNYLSTHAYDNTDTADLWSALSASAGVDVGAIMNTWILQGGHPLVSVEATDTGLRLTQQRCTFAGGDDTPRASWRIPMRLQVSVSGIERELTVLLDQETTDIELGGTATWVLANAGFGGFFRSRYDDELRASLLTRVGLLHPLDRYALVDDAWTLFLGDHQTLTETLDVLRAVAAVETEPSVWRRISSILSNLRVLCSVDQLDDLARIAHLLVGERLHELDRQSAAARATGLDLSEAEHELHGVLFRLSGTIGRSDSTIEAARLRLAALATAARASGDQPANPELDAAAMEVVAAVGTVEEFDTVLEMFRNAPTSQDEIRALSALAQFPDADLVARFCALCLSEVRTQNAPYALSQAMSNASFGPRVWDFVAANWDDITQRFPSSSIERVAGGVRAFSDPDLSASVHAFFETHTIPQAPRLLAQHLERLRVNVAARARVADSLGRYLDESAPNAVRP